MGMGLILVLVVRKKKAPSGQGTKGNSGHKATQSWEVSGFFASQKSEFGVSEITHVNMGLAARTRP